MSGYFFATFDIKALYSNILYELGLQAVNCWLYRHLEARSGQFPYKFILDGIELILENNTLAYYTFIPPQLVYMM